MNEKNCVAPRALAIGVGGAEKQKAANPVRRGCGPDDQQSERGSSLAITRVHTLESHFYRLFSRPLA
ncbi:protein of unknown function [Aminobacter niigataensis]|nr:protein of unknown function [Aminobacter niigataensis]